MSYQLIHGDCLEVMAGMDAGSVDAVVADPPYNIGKAAWDKVGDYLAWSDRWIAEASRVLKRNGAFWCFHSQPLVLAKLSGAITKHGRGMVNWVTWDKYNGAGARQGFMDGFTMTGVVRSFQPMAEFIVWHADEGEWTSASDQSRGFIFEPLRAYLDGERVRAGVDKADCNVACGFSHSAGGMASRHYFSRSQWQLPTSDHYESLRRLFGPGYLRREYDDLRREYDDLRREYVHLRYTFHNPGKVSSVWQFSPAKPNGHPTPKPEPLIERIILATTNEGDTVLDPFAGSGTTGVVCTNTGRDFIGIEREAEYVEIAERRIEAAAAQERLPV